MSKNITELRLYIVQPKDTLEIIATKHGVTIEEIVRFNPLVKNKLLYPGLPMNIPYPANDKDEIIEVETFDDGTQKVEIFETESERINFLYRTKDYIDNYLLISDKEILEEDINSLIDSLFIEENSTNFRKKDVHLKEYFVDIKNNVQSFMIAVYQKNIELIKKGYSAISESISKTYKFLDKKVYQKVSNTISMWIIYIVKFINKKYDEAQKVFYDFIHKIRQKKAD